MFPDENASTQIALEKRKVSPPRWVALGFEVFYDTWCSVLDCMCEKDTLRVGVVCRRLSAAAGFIDDPEARVSRAVLSRASWLHKCLCRGLTLQAVDCWVEGSHHDGGVQELLKSTLVGLGAEDGNEIGASWLSQRGGILSCTSPQLIEFDPPLEDFEEAPSSYRGASDPASPFLQMRVPALKETLEGRRVKIHNPFPETVTVVLRGEALGAGGPHGGPSGLSVLSASSLNRPPSSAAVSLSLSRHPSSSHSKNPLDTSQSEERKDKKSIGQKRGERREREQTAQAALSVLPLLIRPGACRLVGSAAGPDLRASGCLSLSSVSARRLRQGKGGFQTPRNHTEGAQDTARGTEGNVLQTLPEDGQEARAPPAFFPSTPKKKPSVGRGLARSKTEYIGMRRREGRGTRGEGDGSGWGRGGEESDSVVFLDLSLTDFTLARCWILQSGASLCLPGDFVLAVAPLARSLWFEIYRDSRLLSVSLGDVARVCGCERGASDLLSLVRQEAGGRWLSASQRPADPLRSKRVKDTLRNSLEIWAVKERERERDRERQRRRGSGLSEGSVDYSDFVSCNGEENDMAGRGKEREGGQNDANELPSLFELLSYSLVTDSFLDLSVRGRVVMRRGGPPPSVGPSVTPFSAAASSSSVLSRSRWWESRWTGDVSSGEVSSMERERGENPYRQPEDAETCGKDFVLEDVVRWDAALRGRERERQSQTQYAPVVALPRLPSEGSGIKFGRTISSPLGSQRAEMTETDSHSKTPVGTRGQKSRGSGRTCKCKGVQGGVEESSEVDRRPQKGEATRKWRLKRILWVSPNGPHLRALRNSPFHGAGMRVPSTALKFPAFLSLRDDDASPSAATSAASPVSLFQAGQVTQFPPIQERERGPIFSSPALAGRGGFSLANLGDVRGDVRDSLCGMEGQVSECADKEGGGTVRRHALQTDSPSGSTSVSPCKRRGNAIWRSGKATGVMAEGEGASPSSPATTRRTYRHRRSMSGCIYAGEDSMDADTIQVAVAFSGAPLWRVRVSSDPLDDLDDDDGAAGDGGNLTQQQQQQKRSQGVDPGGECRGGGVSSVAETGRVLRRTLLRPIRKLRSLRLAGTSAMPYWRSSVRHEDGRKDRESPSETGIEKESEGSEGWKSPKAGGVGEEGGDGLTFSALRHRYGWWQVGEKVLLSAFKSLRRPPPRKSRLSILRTQTSRSGPGLLGSTPSVSARFKGLFASVQQDKEAGGATLDEFWGAADGLSTPGSRRNRVGRGRRRKGTRVGREMGAEVAAGFHGEGLNDLLEMGNGGEERRLPRISLRTVSKDAVKSPMKGLLMASRGLRRGASFCFRRVFRVERSAESDIGIAPLLLVVFGPVLLGALFFNRKSLQSPPSGSPENPPPFRSWHDEL
uniref:Transmembrane protein n=1 Tax=Chromera velia CCMP2878 TaxID=1169474 RepID=A0A0G4HSP5_9ALVE|eukprot:Cvel_31040.t1-p1 / transcript=Cvel_31040.t1 / gene=Cvel_31040 / organism=Chromera_velia_CCMP2878 / gene_product=hypothetical protein / transcript_product=hypothetical protein / location=Cvel_scaffold4547:2010-7666(-) / protein_length=1385 / sequence_SO=supercontig / SO=protein_coding / is_pseudo=false